MCNGFVQFVIARDSSAQFCFASLQSKTGVELLEKNFLPVGEMSTIVLRMDDRIYTKSDASLRILSRLDGPWKCLRALLIVPRFLRDAVYDVISRNRYRWFGRRTECAIPSPEICQRFL